VFKGTFAPMRGQHVNIQELSIAVAAALAWAKTMPSRSSLRLLNNSVAVQQVHRKRAPSQVVPT